MARKLSLALGLVVLCSLTISGARKPSLSLSFHLEGLQLEGSKMVQQIKLGSPPKVYYFRRAPELTQRHVVGYYPFPARDGTGFGVAFKLNQNGTITLDTLSSANPGKRLMTVLNSEPVDSVVMDQPIRDGYVVVWGGITKADLAKFDKKFKRIQPADNNTQKLVPNRATSTSDSEPALRIHSDDEDAEPKKRRRLLNFGRRKDD